MNCDEAFDFLTTPHCRPNRQFEWHLAMCPRCRQMKETLEPALMLFDDNDTAQYDSLSNAFTLDEEFPQHEIHHHKAVSAEAVRLAECTAAELSSEISSERPRLPRVAGLMASQVALIFLGAVIAFGLVNLPGDLQSPSTAVASETCLWQNSNQTDSISKANSRIVVSTCLKCHWKEAATAEPIAIGTSSSMTDCRWITRPVPSQKLGVTARNLILSCMGCHI